MCVSCFMLGNTNEGNVQSSKTFQEKELQFRKLGTVRLKPVLQTSSLLFFVMLNVKSEGKMMKDKNPFRRTCSRTSKVYVTAFTKIYKPARKLNIR
jgi:hypothetical protein